ncbi:hypothetical protein LJC35_04000, partial [Parabacteroides sp. OttesenSCG-928-N08]|nr:hypothetical protein [Parabacteroides sp. OttesenSCG-928-N08]
MKKQLLLQETQATRRSRLGDLPESPTRLRQVAVISPAIFVRFTTKKRRKQQRALRDTAENFASLSRIPPIWGKKGKTSVSPKGGFVELC